MGVMRGRKALLAALLVTWASLALVVVAADNGDGSAERWAGQGPATDAAAASCNIQGCAKCPKGGSECTRCAGGYQLNSVNTCDCSPGYATSADCTLDSKACRCKKCPSSATSPGGPLTTTRCVPKQFAGTYNVTIALSGGTELTRKASKQLTAQLRRATLAQPNVTRGSVKVIAPKVATSSPARGATRQLLGTYSFTAQVNLSYPRGAPNPSTIIANAINAASDAICAAYLPGYDFCAEVARMLPGQTVASASATDNSPAPPYYMFRVTQDVTVPPPGVPPQPFPRGLGHVRQIEVTLGSGSSQFTYTQTVDTGSGLLNMPCTTPDTQTKGCGGTLFSVSASANYGSAAQCSNIMNGSSTGGSGCYSGKCSWAQGLTGGGQVNMNSGIMSFNTPITLNGLVESNVNTSSTFQFVGAAACAELTGQCVAGAQSCLSSWASCPPNPTQSNCITPGGIEMGFTFTPTAVPGQLVTTGVIPQVLGVCFTQPQSDTQCAQTGASNDLIFMGPAPLPSDVNSAPLFPYVWQPSGVPLGPADNPMMTTNEFRSIIASSSVPGYTCQNPSSGCVNRAPFSTPFTTPSSQSAASINMLDFAQVGLSVLWDTGAYGVFHVDQFTFGAYSNGFTSRLADLQGTNGFTIEPCSYNYAWSVCGQTNIMTGPPFPPNVCNVIRLNATSQVPAAQAVLSQLHPNLTYSLWPNNTPATSQGGWNVVDCTGPYPAVASCSYVQNSTGVWVGGPWFSNKWSQMDLRQPFPGVPASWGTYTWGQSACPY